MWRKVLRVMWTEFCVAIRSKTFLVGVIMLPLMVGGGGVVQYLTRDKTDVSDRKLGVVDRTGRFMEVIHNQAKERSEKQVYRGSGEARKKVRPDFLVEELDELQEGEDGILALSDRVRNKELFGFIVIEKNVFDVNGAGVSYYTETPGYEELPNWIEGVVSDEVRRVRFEEAGLDQKEFQKLMTRVSVKRLGLAKVNSSTGEVVKAKEENRAATFGVPAVSLFLMFMLVVTTGSGLLNAVLEEKLQKIAEVLISSVTPFELMLGKLLGNLGVSLCLSSLYLGAASFLVYRAGKWGELIGWYHVGWFLIFQILAFLSFGAICMAIGAACSEIRDAQNLMFPAMMLYMIPIFCWAPILQSPSSQFSRWVSWFPTATPCLMMTRMFLPPGPPWWEVAVGIAGTLVFLAFCVWFGGKIFRMGLLFQGQTPSVGQLLRWMFQRD